LQASHANAAIQQQQPLERFLWMLDHRTALLSLDARITRLGYLVMPADDSLKKKNSLTKVQK
jgi:hypothetical protein